MSLPSSASKANCDSTGDDPKLALTVDLADLIDKFNALITHLGGSGILTGGTTAAMGIGQGVESDGDAASPLLRAKIVSGGGIGRGASGLSLDISGMTEETSVDATADFVPLYDASGTVVRKVKVQNLLPAATQVQAEAASSNVVALTPGNALWHPGVAKASVVFDGTGATGSKSALSAYAISAINKTATGLYTLTPSVAFSSADKILMAAVAFNSGNNLVVMPDSTTDFSTTAIPIAVRTLAGTATDATRIRVVLFGDQ